MKTSRMDQYFFLFFCTQQQSALNKCFMGPEFQQPAAFPTETQRVMSGLFFFYVQGGRKGVEGEKGGGRENRFNKFVRSITQKIRMLPCPRLMPSTYVFPCVTLSLYSMVSTLNKIR